MKTVVIYKSKTGFTRKYADWIAEELSADIFEFEKVTADMLADYNTVIYGGGLYAVSINGIKLILENLDKLKDKRIIVFATGASPAREETSDEIRNKNFTTEQQKRIHFFYMRGGFDYSKLKAFDRMLMTLLKWKIKGKKELTEDEKGMLAIYDKPVDFTRKDNINKVVDCVRKQ
jgi:menaquinone-dependent protoporphyrinogen IX oxidase